MKKKQILDLTMNKMEITEEHRLISEATDMSNTLIYLLKDNQHCDFAQETIDTFRELVDKLLVDKRIEEENSLWLWEHLL